MSNMDKARELTKVAAESQGMAELKYQAYMESSEAATKRLQNAWEGLTNSLKTSDFLKVVKNGLSWLIEHLDKAVSLFGTMFLTMKTMRSMNIFHANGQGLFGGLFGGMKNKAKGAWNVLAGYAGGDAVPKFLQKFDGYLRSISSSVQNIEAKESTRGATGTPGTGVPGGASGAAGLVGRPTIHVLDDQIGGRSAAQDIKTGRVYYTDGQGRRQRISTAATADILSKQGVVTAKTLGTVRGGKGSRTFARGEDGNWYQVKSGQVSKHPMRFTDRGPNALNVQYMNAQADYQAATKTLGDLKFDSNKAYTVEGNKKWTTATYNEATGKWVYGNNKEVAASKVAALTAARQKDLDAYNAQRQSALQAQKDAQNSMNAIKQQQKAEAKQRASAAAAAGLTAGITAGMTTGMSFKNSDGGEASNEAKWAVGLSTGLTTAVSTGLISAIPYVGPVLGPTLGPIIGNVFGTYVAPMLGNMIDQQKIARRERSKDAEKSYSAIKAIQGDTNTLKELSTETWSYDDYTKANTALNNIFTQLYGNTSAARNLYDTLYGAGSSAGMSDVGVVDLVKTWLSSNYLGGDATTRQRTIEQWERALYQAEVETYKNSKENEIYENKQILNTTTVGNEVFKIDKDVRKIINDFADENEGALALINGDKKVQFSGTAAERQATERQLLNYLEDQGYETTSFYKKLQKNVADISNALSSLDSTVDEINNKQATAAAITANFGQYSTAQLKKMGIDKIAEIILQEVNKQGGFWNEDGSAQYQYYWTGSLDTMASTAKKYIETYIKNNATLYGIFSNESYTLGEVNKGALTGAKADEYKLKFAKELNITIEELNANMERYSSFSLGDIMKGYSEVKTALEEIDGLFSSIVSSSGMTADNLTTMLSKYPELISRTGDIGSMVTAIFDKTSVYMEIQKNNLTEELGTNGTLFTQWKQSLSQAAQDAIDQSNLGNLSNGTSFWQAWLNLSDQDKKNLGESYEEIQKSFKEYYNGFSFEAVIDSTILDKWRSYLSQIYELQISNLEAQKSAMQNINSQREYENKLIEARNKLENAQNDKHMVYREGIGMVYEADQEAVAEAQKEIDELENEKIVDRLDMTIVELRSQKEWLDDFDKRNEFQNLSESFSALGEVLKGQMGSDTEKILGAIGDNDTTGLWGTVNKLFNLYDERTKIESEGFTESLELQNASSKEEVNNLFDQYKGEVNDYGTISEALNEYRLSGDRSKLMNTLSNVKQNASSDAVRQYTTSLMNDITKSNYSAESLVNATRTTKEQRNTAIQNASSAAAKLANTYHQSSADITDYTSETGKLKELAEAERAGKPKLAATEIQSAKEAAIQGVLAKLSENKYGGFHRIKSQDGVQDWLVGLNSQTGSATTWDTELLAALYDYFNSADYDVDLSAFEKNSGAYNNIKSEMKKAHYNSTTNAGFMGSSGYGQAYLTFVPSNDEETLKTLKLIWPGVADEDFFKEITGNWFSGYKYNYLPGQLPSGKNVLSMDTIGYYHLLKIMDMIFDNAGIIPQATTAAELSYALGSINTAAGLASISEAGPELFTTPGLSGAALIPEGSKVLPAEATKGLWQFGAMASQFIRPLQSIMSNYTTNGNSLVSTDESTNIQTLNIALKADKDFDVDKFIQQLKLLQAISKHNS